MDQIASIVEALNKPPFDQRLTLVSFSSKSPLSLLQLLSDVFGFIDAKQKVDLRDEPTDTTALRLLEFMAVINYKIEGDLLEFKERLMRGEPEIVYPVLSFVLGRQEASRKRAYLANYLRPLDVPEDFFGDPAIVALYQRYKELQDEFKELHKQAEKARAEAVNPDDVKRDFIQLENERELVSARLAKLKEKEDYQSQTFQEMLQATNALRLEQEEESKLMNALREQTDMLQHNERELRAAQARLKEVEESDMQRLPPESVLERQRKRVHGMEEAVSNFDKEIRDRDKVLRELEQGLAVEPLSEDQVDDLQAEVADLQAWVAQLTAKRDRMQDASDAKIGFYRERASAANKKLEQTNEQVAELEQEMKELLAERARLEEAMSKLELNPEHPKTEEEMKEYMRKLQEKTERYRALKAELTHAEDEIRVLERTEQTLRSRCDNIEAFVKEEEQRRGIQGASTLQGRLEEASSAKSAVDQDKAQALDQITTLVQDITANIKARKNKLKPIIEELKHWRARDEEVEAEYKKKKALYSAVLVGHSSDRQRLEKELMTARQQHKQEESNYHLMNAMTLITQTRLEQARAEAKYASGQGRLSAERRTYKELYEQTILSYEALGKRLQADKKEVQELFEDNIGQRQAFADLVKLLQCKVQLNSEMQEMAANAQSSNLMQEADRLVFD